jgi:hypothetical protein
VLRFEVPRSVITVQREFRARFKKYIILVWCVFFKPCIAPLYSQILTNHNGANRKLSPAATPSCKLVPRPRSKHEKQTAGNSREMWTVSAADSVSCSRVGEK